MNFLLIDKKGLSFWSELLFQGDKSDKKRIKRTSQKRSLSTDSNFISLSKDFWEDFFANVSPN